MAGQKGSANIKSTDTLKIRRKRIQNFKSQKRASRDPSTVDHKQYRQAVLAEKKAKRQEKKRALKAEIKATRMDMS